jgi:Flp pilus assembly pilin Flp
MLTRLRNLLRDTSGLAALEFALIAGPLALMMLAIFDITFRFQAADEFERYLYQFGDLLSRDDDLSEDDLDTIYEAADQMMQQVNVEEGALDIAIASIGFQQNGDPVKLWQRWRGGLPGEVDVEAARGLAAPGESVIQVSATLRYTSAITVLSGGDDLSEQGVLYFKPRTTRAIAFEGKIHDAGISWDGYTAGSS